MSKDKKSEKYMPQISYHKKENKDIDDEFNEHEQDNLEQDDDHNKHELHLNSNQSQLKLADPAAPKIEIRKTGTQNAADLARRQEPASPQIATGPAGPQGIAGPAGLQGPAGPQGATGPAGPQGVAGPIGPQGVAGPAGLQGPAGPQGATGPVGPAGPAGADGATGPVGPQGATGPQGPVGPVGPVGPAGADGATGPVGSKGVAGPQGPAGPTGPQGAAGPAGPQGPVGPIGPQGATGPAGPQGIAGPQGTPGSAVGLSSYGYVYEVTDSRLDLTIAGGGNIPFSNNASLNNIIHIAGSDTITINTAGDYEIYYSVNSTYSVDAEIALAAGPGAMPPVVPSTRVSILSGVGVVSGQAILTLAAGDIIHLRNSAIYAIEAITLAPGPTVSAQMTIKRLN